MGVYMRKKKKNRQKTITPVGRSVLSVLNVPLPKVSVPEEQMMKLRHAARTLQKVEVVPFQVFAHIATNAWRAKVKMVDSDTGEAKEEMKRVYRHIEAIFEALKQIGVEITDHTGRAYDSGMALKVISFEPTAGLSKEEIKETIKPTVVWRGRLIQMGEVIVGTPATT